MSYIVKNTDDFYLALGGAFASTQCDAIRFDSKSLDVLSIFPDCRFVKLVPQGGLTPPVPVLPPVDANGTYVLKDGDLYLQANGDVSARQRDAQRFKGSDADILFSIGLGFRPVRLKLRQAPIDTMIDDRDDTNYWDDLDGN